MPQAVIPFKLNFKSFAITILVIMVVVRLLFVILGALLRRSWWWKKITAWTKEMQLDVKTQIFSTCEYGSRLALRRDRNYRYKIIDGVEMNTLGV